MAVFLYEFDLCFDSFFAGFPLFLPVFPVFFLIFLVVFLSCGGRKSSKSRLATLDARKLHNRRLVTPQVAILE